MAPHDDNPLLDDGLSPTGLSVDPSDEHELAFWSSVWNVTAEEVRQAVRFVGHEADSVSRYLGLQRSQSHRHAPH